MSGLQVSDREYQTGKPTTAERLQKAEQLVKEGHGNDILFRDDDAVGTPVSATRFASLAGRNGDDDMFSSDFTDQELKVRSSAQPLSHFAATVRDINHAETCCK